MSPVSSLNVIADSPAFTMASCNPSKSELAIYINLNGSAKSPTAPPITCKFAAKSIAPSGSKTFSIRPLTLDILRPNLCACAAILVNPWTPSLKLYALTMDMFSATVFINLPTFSPIL